MTLYLFGFFLLAASLLGWTGLHKSGRDFTRLFQLSMLGGGLLYLLGLLSAPVGFAAGMGMAARDLLVLAGLGFVLQIMPGKRLFWLAGSAMLVSLWFFYRPTMQSVWSSNQDRPADAVREDITLDGQGELLIELAEGVQVSDIQHLTQRYGLRLEPAFTVGQPNQTLLDNYWVADVPDERFEELGNIMATLQDAAEVAWVEENEMIRVEPMRSETTIQKVPRKNYGVDDPGLEELWSFDAMEIDLLYQNLRRGKIKPHKVARIAILDTGIDADHEDIAANYRSVASKHDNDPRGHGTHCAGIAASVSNNGVGVASFSPDNGFVEVSSIRVLNNMGMGTQRSIIQGMIEAADAKVDVISMSLGGRSNSQKQRAYNKAVKYANQAGAIVVAAAGNSNRNAKEFSPVNAKGVIGVSAIDPDLQRAVFSNYVTDLPMGLAAPGVQIYSTVPNDEYATYNGTSMATPYVAGAVGLLKSMDPTLTTKEVWQLLRDHGKDTRQTSETGKLIVPHAALGALLSSNVMNAR